MENEFKFKKKLIESLESEIEEYQSDLKKLLEYKKEVLALEPSDEILFARNFDFDDEIIIPLKVGMTFVDKYGQRGIIKKINSDRLSVLFFNTDTEQEEIISIDRIRCCWNE